MKSVDSISSVHTSQSASWWWLVEEQFVQFDLCVLDMSVEVETADLRAAFSKH